jgi:membrane-associated phospholipid phosphatase
VAATLLLFAFTAFTGNNTSFFLALNGVSAFTGDGVWAHLTVLGDTLVALTLLLAFAGRRPWILWSGVFAALLATLWVHGLKDVLDMPRPASVLPPELVHVIGPVLKKGSFPSGHATAAFTLATVLCLHVQTNAWRWTILTVATLVAISRIVVGVHWPLDVLAGAFGGWLSGVAGTLLAQRWPQGLSMRAQLLISAILAACAIVLIVRPDPIYAGTGVFQVTLALACLALAALSLWSCYRIRDARSL